MSKSLNDNLRISAGKPVDAKYLNSANTPYTATTQVTSQIPLSERHIGLTVTVNGIEYWFRTGVTNNSLIPKIPTVSNGLTQRTHNYTLGGSLTGHTTIGGVTKAHGLRLGGTTTGGSDELAHLEVRGGYVDIRSASGLTLQGGTTATLNAATQIVINAGSNSPQFTLNTTTAQFLDRRATKRGIEYAGNYSSGFTLNSLITRGYLLDQLGTATGSTFVLAVNGLTKNGSFIKLGGVITGTTSIDATSQTFYIKTSTLSNKSGFIKGDVGSTANVQLLSFKDNTGSTLTQGLTDIIVGPHSGNAMLTGATAGNISVGHNNLLKLTSSPTEFNGGRNVAIGYYNITGQTNSTHNIAIGRLNGNGRSGSFDYSINIGYENGWRARNDQNTQHIAMGVWNMYGLTAHTGTQNMIAIGYNNMVNSSCDHGESSVVIGQNSLSWSKFERYQIAMGDYAGSESRLGRANIMIGTLAGASVTGGTSGSTGIGNVQFNVALGTHAWEFGSGNKGTWVGCEAGSSGVRGFGNSGFGVWSGNRFRGDYNSGLGSFAGYHVSLYLTGSTNSFIGYRASYGINSLTNSIVIGNNYNATQSNKIVIGSSTQDTVIVKFTSGSTSSDIVVRGNGGQLETRKAGSMNNLTVRVISANTITTSTDHLLLVTTASSGLTVTLRSTPEDGESLIIKDRSGNANVRNITILGNGKNIDGSSSAIINTNYGAARLAYSSVADAWFSIGMVI
jgi:hypothetical protein